MSLKNVKSNIVQSIRAFSVSYLKETAQETGQRFFYVNLAAVCSRDEAVKTILAQFNALNSEASSYDTLSKSITDALYKAGVQAGVIIVLEQIPLNTKFDKEARESLLDIFREAADFWADRKIPFRCFYSFSVARTVKTPQENEDNSTDLGLADISTQALCMSSPFNTDYWLAAANQQEEATAA